MEVGRNSLCAVLEIKKIKMFMLKLNYFMF